MQHVLLIAVIVLLYAVLNKDDGVATYYAEYWQSQTDKPRMHPGPDLMWRRYKAEELSGGDVEQVLHKYGGSY